MKTWSERPSAAEVESVVRGYVGLVRAGRVADAARLVDHASTRHVLASLWRAAADAGDPIRSLEDGWQQDLSWLGEVDITEDIRWGETGSHLCVDVTYRGMVTELELSFWVKPTASGWVIAGPATLW
ncbi:hypothetical protein ACQPZJ_26980 [Actinoplanes sp. CA-054009]